MMHDKRFDVLFDGQVAMWKVLLAIVAWNGMLTLLAVATAIAVSGD